ncbi:MAG: GGDEF domain-containing protein [Pseudomonadota bacterium]
MRRSVDTAYWVYAAGAIGSVVLAGLVALRNIEQATMPVFLRFSLVELALAMAAITLLFGLVLVMPMLRRNRRAHEQLNTRAAELEVEVVTDPLTKLYNRRYFEDALDQFVREFTKLNAPLAVLMLDLDHFKSVNDTYGHDAGDVVLKKLATQLKGLVREHDVVARTGGEEFCIVAPFASQDQIRPFAERICRSIGNMRVDIGVVVLRPTISIGVASTAEGITAPKELVKLADERLYQAKEQGRNRVAC